MTPDWSIHRFVRVSSGAGHVLKYYVNVLKLCQLYDAFSVLIRSKNILNQRNGIRSSNWLEAKPVGNLHSVVTVELNSEPPTEDNSSQCSERD